MTALLSKTQRFMGIDFIAENRAGIRNLVLHAAHHTYSYLVTPNVDDLVKSLGGTLTPQQALAFLQADIKICDSRVLARLSRLARGPLVQYPGSDLVKDVLTDPAFAHLIVAIVGPSRDEFDGVARCYADRVLVFIDAAMPLNPDTGAWYRCVDDLVRAEWDIAMICLPLPRQQLIAHDLRRHGRERGLAMCVGASIDFLSGKQRRAPVWMQRYGFEWLYRLLSNPKRLWRRYLVEGPRIFPLFLALEVWPRVLKRRVVREHR